MKLTKAIRENIVTLIMADVPVIDYDSQVRDAIVSKAKEMTPKVILDLATKEATAKWFGTQTVYIQNIGYIAVLGPEEDSSFYNALKEHVKPLVEKHHKQLTERSNIKVNLEVTLSTCNTDKELIERFPEFAKYLPKEGNTLNLPATTAVMDSLKAAGWPNKKPEPKAAKARTKPNVKA